ncbi:TonB family protein [Myxococcus sp. K15C18031901]|uniref:TonB family protein n=1 Tax=Myxococcus dinghuensis TaxID=2906761 RepID=UPI0020A7917C|nr:TonB family protein [Myxococcus dinghuensis]MCP3099476.1 TonB family protein [Myxococcus dinghuensis]
MPRPEQPPSISSIVLGPPPSRRSRGTWWAVATTVALHGAAGLLAYQAWRKPERPLTPPAPKQTLQINHVVDLKPPPLPAPPPPAPRAEPPPARAARNPGPAPREAPARAAPEPAQAGAVVAAKEPAEPLDFTDFDMTTGDAPRYAGGVTASNGRSATAVNTAAAGERIGQGTGGSRARPVQLSARSWSCPWPKEADTLRIDDQTVVLRVSVDADGEVTAAELLSDPGHGFGQAALACARRARFDTALDREGRPLAATSPPIRVRFVRP